VIADIHFDYRLAIAAVEAGVAAIRINPGNLGGDDRLAAVAAALRTSGTPVRVGVNGGSLEKRLLTAHGGPTPDALAASAREQCAKLEAMGVTRIKVSIKSSDVLTTVQACRLFAAGTDYPLHLGVTEAGTPLRGVVKSAVGIGALLIDGIGDTIRVSLTADPVEEVKAALRILEAVGLRNPAPEVVSCPTCGRTRIDLEGLVHEVEAEIDRLKAAGFQLPVRKVAIMGCVVNGPGEARDADLGVAGGDGFGVLFRAGRVVERVPEEELGPRLVHELQRLAVRPDDHDPCPADGNAGARRGD
jgi:(E)-4-hydroxy-3-methylbut-2-enyl-diphosphate synthase